MRILVSGGGTAGHVYPALTVARSLSAGGHDDVAFVGTPDGLEARLVPEAGITFFGLRARGFDRSRPLSLLGAAVVILASAMRAFGLIRRWRPDVVVGFGGYVSLPLGLAAVLRRVPLVLHEQNSIPGLANRILCGWADRAGITYPASAAHMRCEHVEVTGNPVRPAVLAADREVGRRALGLSNDDLVLLVFGGSQGARHLNSAVVGMYERLAPVPRLHVVHVAGRLEAPAVREALRAAGGAEDPRYDIHEYIEDMGSALAAADLIVARAGATSIAEITALGRPSVLVPYPYATDDHQTLNARAVEEGGGAAIVADVDLDGPAFGDVLLSLLADDARRTAMARAAAALGRPDAAARVVAMVREAARPTQEASPVTEDGRDEA